MTDPTREPPAVEPEVTTRSPWHISRIPGHLGRARTSTVVLGALFVAIFALYLNIRPDTAATTTSGNQVPASTTAPVQRTTAPATTPAPTQNRPTPTETPTPTSVTTDLPTPSATPSGTGGTSGLPTSVSPPTSTLPSPSG